MRAFADEAGGQKFLPSKVKKFYSKFTQMIAKKRLSELRKMLDCGDEGI